MGSHAARPAVVPHSVQAGRATKVSSRRLRSSPRSPIRVRPAAALGAVSPCTRNAACSWPTPCTSPTSACNDRPRSRGQCQLVAPSAHDAVSAGGLSVRVQAVGVRVAAGRALPAAAVRPAERLRSEDAAARVIAVARHRTPLRTVRHRVAPADPHRRAERGRIDRHRRRPHLHRGDAGPVPACRRHLHGQGTVAGRVAGGGDGDTDDLSLEVYRAAVRAGCGGRPPKHFGSDRGQSPGVRAAYTGGGLIFRKPFSMRYE